MRKYAGIHGLQHDGFCPRTFLLTPDYIVLHVILLASSTEDMNLDGISVSGPSMKDKKISRIDETFPRPHSILTNSSLWQSEIWNRATTKISAEETAWVSLRLA